MAHKSHRQKALQSQLEPQPALSLVEPSSSKKKEKAVATQGDNEMDVDDSDDVLISSGPSTQPASAATGSSSGFAPLSQAATNGVLKNEFRRVPVPPHRMSPLKREWVNLYTPMVDMLGLQVRMNVKRRAVELKVSLTSVFLLLRAESARIPRLGSDVTGR